MKTTKPKPLPTTAVYAGSFDPPTVGHLWMIEQAARLFPRLIVAVGLNPDKRSTFTANERLAMLGASVGPHRHIEFAAFGQRYLIDYARSVGAGFIIRGIRSGGDYEYERAMRNINGDLAPQITTLFLMPPRDIAEVSSSMVKGLIGPRGWKRIIRPYVSAPVYEKILARFDAR